MLQFSRSTRSGALNLLLLDSQDGSPLQVCVRADWKKRVDSRDQAYLTDLMDDWKNTEYQQVPELLNELCRQSHGPLRVIERGEVSSAGRQALIDRVMSSVEPS